MAVTSRSIELRLLRYGTAAGPVTKDMIDEAKRLYLKNGGKDKRGWTDFLAMVREGRNETPAGASCNDRR